MIAFVEGTLEQAGEEGIVVACGGIGYEILIPTSDLEYLPARGGQVRIYTYLQSSENTGLSLYGFLSREALAMFRLLITVNGIGPKGALSILSVLSVDTLRFAILSEDAKSIAKAPGIGAKTASRMILDLKDKISLEDALEQRLEKTTAAAASNGQASADAVEALVALGYARAEALRAVRQAAEGTDDTADELLRKSLKYLG